MSEQSPGERVEAFQAPTGTRDVLPPESARFAALIERFGTLARRAGYGLVVSPLFEDPAVFRRSAGEESDIAKDEMYEFADKGGRPLALRPEGTASVVRAFVQHRPVLPWKTWYVTPAFRYERPQAGRYRQHHQLGVEALGSEDADLDVEVIALGARYLGAVGLGNVALKINSMGDGACMPAYREALIGYLATNEARLCDGHRQRWKHNPLRVLDCKNAACKAVTAQAPRLSAFWCKECRAHYDRVRTGLGALGVGFCEDDFLVRGFDYYTRTPFEFAALSLDAAQNVVLGGGRYNGLVEQLGGPHTPGIGFGSGIERVLLAADAEGALADLGRGIDVFVVDVTDGSAARDLTEQLRAAGIGAERAFDQRSMKAQLKLADRSGARVAVIVGADERARGVAMMRDLRGEDRNQTEVPLAELVEALRARR